MLGCPRFALSEFSVFTYMKLENSYLENSDFSKTSQNSLQRYKLKEETYFQKFKYNKSNKLCSFLILNIV